MSAKKKITVTVDKSAFEVLRTHGFNVSYVCNEAIIRQSEMVRTSKPVEEQIREHKEHLDFLLSVQAKQLKEEEVREESIGGLDEREDQAMETVERMYKIHGFLSKPSVEKLCTQKDINFDTFWLKIPAELTANAKHFSYEDLTGTKTHTGFEGKTGKTNLFG